MYLLSLSSDIATLRPYGLKPFLHLVVTLETAKESSPAIAKALLDHGC